MESNPIKSDPFSCITVTILSQSLNVIIRKKVSAGFHVCLAVDVCFRIEKEPYSLWLWLWPWLWLFSFSLTVYTPRTKTTPLSEWYICTP